MSRLGILRDRPGGDFYLDVSLGNLSEYSVVHKFGRNVDIGTTFEPITLSGLYRTPQVGSATQLRVKAGNANDTAAGTGAREITLVGIDASGDEVTETLATAGTSASSNTSNSYIRLYRVFVSASGTYATATAGSHAGDITIENAAGTEDWLTISSSNFPSGQSEVGAYTVPNGYQALIKNVFLYIDSTKPMSIILFQRRNILETAAPYSAMRAVYEIESAEQEVSIARELPLGPFPAGTDIGFMARKSSGSGTGSASVNFDIILQAV